MTNVPHDSASAHPQIAAFDSPTARIHPTHAPLCVQTDGVVVGIDEHFEFSGCIATGTGTLCPPSRDAHVQTRKCSETAGAPLRADPSGRPPGR